MYDIAYTTAATATTTDASTRTGHDSISDIIITMKSASEQCSVSMHEEGMMRLQEGRRLLYPVCQYNTQQ